MILDASRAISKWGFRWKPSSLECLSVSAQKPGGVSPEKECNMGWNKVVPDLYPATEPQAALPYRGLLDSEVSGTVEQLTAPTGVVIRREDNLVPLADRSADILYFEENKHEGAGELARCARRSKHQFGAQPAEVRTEAVEAMC